MKGKKLLPLSALLTAGCALFLCGCSVDVTTINEEEVPMEVAMEEQNLAEGMIIIHSVWSDADGNALSNATISFYNGSSLVFSGTTNDSGSLETCTLPCNTELLCTVTDSLGNSYAESEIVIKLSEDYSEISIYPPKATDEDEDETPSCVIEVPIERTNIRAAIFVTESGAINFANLTPYVEPEVILEEEEEEEAGETEEEEAEVTESEEAEAAEEGEGENAEEGEGETAEESEGESAEESEGGEGESEG